MESGVVNFCVGINVLFDCMSQKNNFESPQCPENSSSKGAKSRDKK
jgi:hypothetical protein